MFNVAGCHGKFAKIAGKLCENCRNLCEFAMSTLAKTTLSLSCVVSLGIIGYVHYKQQSDRSKLHEGVIKDVERQQRRKLENTYRLQEQIELTKQLQKEQDALEKGSGG
ncbi:protein PET117 homolog, mitochondrial [Phlebotomus argentipes]|uniref:protein PET117 homolog, mitochondrial n=1 Tax=Phlebotomus argentipes TaxID=94469 RepID=UPI002892EBAF|nr:protein PET117 homolog, mitochondrial [Phlebotomus argentipes]